MNTAINLVAGRLGPPLSARGTEPFGRYRPARASSYGVSRLGLAPQRPEPARQEEAKPPDPYKKGTFKLATPVLHQLKAHAAATDQYQYRVVGKALKAYLANATSDCDLPERTAAPEIQRQSPQPEQPKARKPAVAPQPQVCFGGDASPDVRPAGSTADPEQEAQLDLSGRDDLAALPAAADLNLAQRPPDDVGAGDTDDSPPKAEAEPTAALRWPHVASRTAYAWPGRDA